jgi:hypothetical protein
VQPVQIAWIRGKRTGNTSLEKLCKSQLLFRTCAGQSVAAGERGRGSPYFAARGQVLQEIKKQKKI